MDLATARRNIRQFGVPKALSDFLLRAVNRVVLVRILKAILIQTVDPQFLECDENRYQGQFLGEVALRALSADPRNELPKEFLDEALAKGDECYGFMAGDSLAAYGWYSSQPTTLDVPGLRLRFAPGYVYMYKGFTAAEHRGQRLHAVGMTRALAAYRDRGYRGIISYVDWNNFGSLRSCYRMGYRDIGWVAITGLGGRYLLHHDAGARGQGFRVERASLPSPPGERAG